MKILDRLRIFFICYNLLLWNFSSAQEIQWQKTIGGNDGDNLSCIQQTSDGGFILAGTSTSNISGDKSENSAYADYWVVKADSSGFIQWQNTIGGNSNDYLSSIQQTLDGGYILGGRSVSNISGDKTENSQGSYDYWVVKIDSTGNIQWQNTIGGSAWDQLNCIQQTKDCGYILGGRSGSNISGDKTENVIGTIAYMDYWIVNIDSIGNIQWQNTIGGSSIDELICIQQTSDGGYILGGNSFSDSSGDKTQNRYHYEDFWIVKTDSLGVIQWDRTIGGYSNDRINSIFQVSDGGYILGGSSRSNWSSTKSENSMGGFDYWILKINSSGNIVWQNTIGGNNDDLLQSVKQSYDGGYILGGYSNSGISGDKTEGCNGMIDYWVVKIDSVGKIEWQNTIGGIGNEYLSSIQQTADSGFIVGGYSDSNISGDKMSNSKGTFDYWIVKLTSKFNSITGKLFLDLNNNTIKDGIEPVLTNKKISEINTERFAFSQPNGNYTLSVVDSGSYFVYPDSIAYYYPVPPSISATFTANQQSDSLNDFAFQPAGIYNDLCVSISTLGPFRSGFNANYMITYGNYGTTSISGDLIFYPDSNITYVSAGFPPVIITVDSIVWNTGLLIPYQTGNILVAVHINSGLPLGTSISPTVHINPVIGDANPACNSATWIVHTIGSSDPNNILVSENTLTTTQIITSPKLDYIINFQNTGNDTAFTVKIVNPIDTNYFDLGTIEYVSSSHPVNMNFNQWERNMEFEFENILLPDSNLNEPMSHGFVRYRIKPKSTLSVGDSIKNYAIIYFDFSLPLLTNNAITRILFPTTYSTISVSDCNSYLSPSGNHILTSTGTYIDSIPNAAGGDSIITIYLTINRTYSIIYKTVCESYTSPSGNHIWTMTGIYQDTIQNAVSCDSVITIELSINNSYSSINTSVCDSYTSPSGNYTWTSTGTYFDTIPNSAGCDSAMVIILFINSKSYSAIAQNSCDNYISPSGNYSWSATGTYNDTVSNAQGCDSIISINLIIDTVNIDVIANPPYFMANATGAVYQWMYCDSVLIPGETEQDFIATTNGSYAVIIIQNGCTDTSVCYAVNNVGVHENNFSQELIVFPNPSKNTITVVCRPLSNAVTRLTIFDILGRVIYQFQQDDIRLSEFKKTISVNNLTDGIYFIRMETGNQRLVTKFVKQ